PSLMLCRSLCSASSSADSRLPPRSLSWRLLAGLRSRPNCIACCSCAMVYSGSAQFATYCRSSYLSRAFLVDASNGADTVMGSRPTTRWLTTVREKRDAFTVPSSALVRGLRWRRRRTLPDETRGEVVLVPNLAGAGRCHGARLQDHRRAAAWADLRGH